MISPGTGKLPLQRLCLHPSLLKELRTVSYSLYVYGEGLTYLRLGQPAKAQQALARLEEMLPKTANVRGVHLFVHQAEVAAAAGELEQSCSYLRSGVESAQQLGSSLFRSHALEVYQGMPLAWRREKLVQELAELFQV